MGRSQHKEVLRHCPACGEEKLFPARNLTCGKTCSAGSSRPPDTPGARVVETPGELKIELDRSSLRTIEEVIAAYKIDTRIWECYMFTTNDYGMAMKQTETVKYEGKDGKPTRKIEKVAPIHVPLSQVKAWFRKLKVVSAAIEELKRLKSDAMASAPRLPALVKSNRSSGVMIEISLPDVHFGKLCWGKETGGENYDTRLAMECWNDSMATLLRRVAPYDAEKFLFVVGNDLLHYDGLEQATTAGTPQHSDTRYRKIFPAVRKRITEDIHLLRRIAPQVDVVMVAGNHDTLSVWHMGDSLQVAFAHTAGVSIDNEPVLHKFVEWGEVMLLLTHGNRGKKNDWPLYMATERPSMWGRSRHREVHVGHIHQVRLEEKHGVRMRTLPSLCPPDQWHADNMYTGNLRSAEAYAFHKRDGLIGTVIHTLPAAA